LVKVRFASIDERRVVTVIQTKTGYPATVQFSEEALQCIHRMSFADGRAIPWPYHTTVFARQFKLIVKAAEVRDGCFPWLWRSVGSYADAAQTGNGSRLLGHPHQRVFGKHYEDKAISRKDPTAPPKIA
jgi:hypothetical protein